MRYKLAVFDMDGTILDTLDDLTDSVNYALGECDFALRSRQQVCQFLGEGVWNLLRRAAGDGAFNDDITRLHDLFTEHYEQNCAVKTRPYPGITDCLEILRAHGVLTAVVSNKDDFAVKKLSDRYFPGLFDISLGRKDGIPRKPAPDSVNEVLRLLNVSRDNAVYIGDSETDIQTAANAAMDSLIVTWGLRTVAQLKDAGAGKLIFSAHELAPLILGKLD